MRFIFKFILIILFIPLFLILLIGITVRFQFLVPSFWENAFSTNDTYSKLSVSINKNTISQTVAAGGGIGDVKIFTDLISPENLKDVIDKNIVNVLAYANGSVNEAIVYVPIEKIPKELLTKSFSSLSNQMSLTNLLKEFNVSGISPAEIQMVSRVGMGAWIFLITSIVLSMLLLYLLYLLIYPGKRLIAPGVALIAAGAAGLSVYFLGTIIRVNWTKDLAGSSNSRDSIIGILAPPVIGEILSVWLIYVIVVIIFGLILFFIKKPYNNKSNKSK